MSLADAVARVAALRTQLATLTPAPLTAATPAALFGSLLASQLDPTTSSLGGSVSNAALPVSAAGLGVAAALGAPGSAGGAAATAARRWLGTPYSWGGGSLSGPTLGVDQGATTVGFDCSGLTRYALAQSGVTAPRTSQEQFAAGTPVAPGDLRPGDLVFFDGVPPGHVGIYEGGGRFIHAPHTGAVVEEASLSDGYWEGAYVGARRYR